MRTCLEWLQLAKIHGFYSLRPAKVRIGNFLYVTGPFRLQFTINGKPSARLDGNGGQPYKDLKAGKLDACAKVE